MFNLNLKSNSRKNLCNTNLIVDPFTQVNRLSKWQNKSQNPSQILRSCEIIDLSVGEMNC